MDLCSQIHGVVGFLRRAAHRWWQVVAQVRLQKPRIPQNKDCIEAMKPGFSSQVWLCVLVFLPAAELSWWEPEAAKAKVPRSFFNKARSLVFCCCESSLCLPPPARGGSVEFDGGPAIQLRWRKAGSLNLQMEEATAISSAHYGSAERKEVVGRDVDTRLPWSRDTASWCTISAAVCSRPTLEAIWWLTSPEYFGICSTSFWRPSVDVASVSSGLVPDAEDGGHGLSSLFLQLLFSFSM